MNNGRDGAIQCDDVKRLLGPALVGTNPLDVRKAIVTMDRTMDGSRAGQGRASRWRSGTSPARSAG